MDNLQTRKYSYGNPTSALSVKLTLFAREAISEGKLSVAPQTSRWPDVCRGRATHVVSGRASLRPRRSSTVRERLAGRRQTAFAPWTSLWYMPQLRAPLQSIVVIEPDR
jgi:hypothetical protein